MSTISHSNQKGASFDEFEVDLKDSPNLKKCISVRESTTREPTLKGNPNSS